SSVGDQFGRDGWEEGTALDPLRTFLDHRDGAPFLLWFAPMLPHVPYDAPAEFRAPYERLGIDRRLVDYYANVSWFDALVGLLVDELRQRGLRDDTLILYFSDNGFEIGEFAGFGDGKGTLHEQGFRTPLVVNWPGHVPAAVTRDDLVSLLDVFPTV